MIKHPTVSAELAGKVDVRFQMPENGWESAARIVAKEARVVLFDGGAGTCYSLSKLA